MKTKASLSRRSFLTRSAIASSSFMIVPSYVLGLHGAQSANERLNIAAIGISGQGAGDINGMSSENIVALCDVDWAHGAGTFKKLRACATSGPFPKSSVNAFKLPRFIPSFRIAS